MIELRGIIRFRNGGHRYVDLVVMVDGSATHAVHRLGVDVKGKRGKMITFLAAMYSVRHGAIVWPSHIELESGVE